MNHTAVLQRRAWSIAQAITTDMVSPYASDAEWAAVWDDAYEAALPAVHVLTDMPEQIARASIASYREYTERHGQSPDDATEAAVHEVTEGLAVDVDAVRAEMAANPGPTPAEMEGLPL